MELRRDLIFGLRMLRKNPLLLIVASLSLGLGIGLNTAVFSVVHAALFRGPNIERAGDLVNFYSVKQGVPDLRPNSYADFVDMRERLETVDALVGYSLQLINYERRGLPTLEIGTIVTRGYFELLETRPALGRLFNDGDFDSDAPVVVVSHRFWQKELSAESGSIGTSVRLGSRVFDVIGVLPEDFTGFSRGLIPDIFVPITPTTEVRPLGEVASDGSRNGRSLLDWRGFRFLTLTGRLAPGSTLAQAQAEANALANSLAEEFPDSNLSRGSLLLETQKVRFDPDLDATLVGGAMLLLGVVALVLLVACGNIVNLLLAKAQTRSGEMALRTALGASRTQIVRQLLVESLLYGLISGAVGLLVAALAIRLLAFVRLDLPIEPQLVLRLDPPVLLFTFGVSLIASVIFGLFPALHAGRLALVPLLRSDGTTSAAPGRRRFRPTDLLVIGQVAVSLVLIVTAGLMFRSIGAARDIDTGFEVDRIGVASVDLRSAQVSPDELPVLWRRMKDRVEALPGVEMVTLASRIPLGPSVNRNDFFIPGYRETETDPPIYLDVANVDEDYFATLGLQLVSGRLIDMRDTPDTPRVAVVTEALVRRFWPNESALGKRFRVASSNSTEVEVVGVVRDYKIRTPGESPRPMVHFAWNQRAPTSGGELAYRATNVSERTLEEVVGAMRMEPGLLVMQSTTMARMRDLILLPQNIGSIVATGLGSLALFLSVLGLSGLIVYWVSRRGREIGLRMALGAGRSAVVTLVARRAFALVGFGLILGSVISAVLGRLLEAVLYVPAFDPISLSIGVVVLLVAGVLASVVPVRRAMSIDPMMVLRRE